MNPEEIEDNRLYRDLAYLWPLLSPVEDYEAGAEAWRIALRDTLGLGRHRLLDLGVGGGNHLHFLIQEHDAVAVDLSENMLNLSKRLNPLVEHFVGDMRSVRLNRKFDAVIIHDAINYMLTEEDLKAVFATASAHLAPAGVLLMAPDFFKESLVVPNVMHVTHSDDTTVLTYVQYLYDPDPSDTSYEAIFVYFIHRDGRLQIEQDHHRGGVFPKQTWLTLLKASGFNAEIRPCGVPDGGHEAHMIVAIKR
jgi:SAM-dependent methyltransferase